MDAILNELKKIAKDTLQACTFEKDTAYNGIPHKQKVILPSGDEKYISFWVRDFAMMTESGLVEDSLLEQLIGILASCGQNGETARVLENGLEIPPYAVADHINYDGKAAFFPGTYSSGNDQGSGHFGYLPPLGDNYYFILAVRSYLKQTGNTAVLRRKYNDLTLLERMELAFAGYSIDEKTQLCYSAPDRYTVDWGFCDAIQKTGLLLFPSLLRYQAARILENICKEHSEKFDYYHAVAETICQAVIKTFYDPLTGWFYSSTGKGHQHDVWATAFAVYLGIAKEQKTLQALADGYCKHTAVLEGYVRHILTNENARTDSAWESTMCSVNYYQNGGYWATPTGWYAYALLTYQEELGKQFLREFLEHTRKHASEGSPVEWFYPSPYEASGFVYGTSGVLPYIGCQKYCEQKKSQTV